MKNTIFCFFLFLCVVSAPQAFAVEKFWTGTSDGTSWENDNNWSPAAQPNASDDVSIRDVLNTAVAITQTFEAQSLTLGGQEEDLTATIENFIFGTVNPGSGTKEAVTVLKGGKLIMKGSAGKVTLNGKYKDSEQTATSEPSFVFYVK